MRIATIAGVLLIVAGALGLAYGEFSYTQQRTPLKVGPLELNVSDHEHVAIPQWLALSSIAAGTVLLVLGKRR
ncbi:MAG TPA: hypothetical protein PK027_00910 [Aquimonas sp.]|nr:hypothetical protein [Xanthomonadales bacterium]TXH13070.1 MAG: hypothetical protein E6R02_03565 [Gammaproteobacteria bacterium]HRD72724.1 hypothetical protein [Aquimonas sp.]HRF53005.1 hypothetical protein [Aquimonas sp.]